MKINISELRSADVQGGIAIESIQEIYGEGRVDEVVTREEINL